MRSTIIKGNFPIVNEDCYLAPDEEPQTVNALRRLWSDDYNPGVLVITGDSGVGKSTLISHLLKDSNFTRTLAGLETVHWLHCCNFTSEELFLCEIAEMLGILEDPLSIHSVESFRHRFGTNRKRFLLVVDDVSSDYLSKIVQLTSQFYRHFRTILIGSRGAPETKSAAMTTIRILPSEVYMARLYSENRYPLPNDVRKDQDKMENLRKIGNGLPLIANLITRLFLADPEGTKVALSNPAFTYYPSYNFVTGSLIKVALKHLKTKDHLRYYAFLLFDAGHPLSVDVLAWLWQKDANEIHGVCARYIDFGLAQRIAGTNGATIDSYAVNACLHDALLQDVLDHDLAPNLTQFRQFLLKGKLVELINKDVVQRMKSLFRPSTPTLEPVAQVALRLCDWHLLETICDNSTDEMLLRGCGDDLALLFELFKQCARTKRVHLPFLHCARRCLTFDLDLAMMISMRKKIQTVRILAKLTPRQEETILMSASKYGLVNVVTLLHQHGLGQVDERNEDGLTALMFAAKFGHVKTVEYLIEKGKADVSARETRHGGLTATMLAAKFGHFRVVEYFMCDVGVDLGDRDKNGMTALMHAARCGHLDVCKFFVALGANVNETDCSNRTAHAMASLGTPFHGNYRAQERNDVAAYLRHCSAI